MALITSQQVKERTSIGGNVDADRLKHLIDDVEIMTLENVLGTKLYDKIVTDYGADTLAGDYETLYDDYIVSILCYLTFAEYLRDSVVLAQNGGVYTHTPEDAQPASLDDIEYVAKRNQSKADVYIERMQSFLCDKNIAEYDDSQDNDYDIDPKADVTNIGGWYL